jgi:uncharacterized protein YfaP (DUF2135 family)
MKKVYILFLLISSLLVGCGKNNASSSPSSISSNKCVTGKRCVNLAWDPTTSYADGTPVTVSGYKIYYGNSSRNYTTNLDAGKSTTFTVANLEPGTYYFAVTAYLVGQVNLESSYSNEVNTATNILDANRSQLIELSPSAEAIIEIH